MVKGACMAKGACVTGRHAWHRGMHGKGVCMQERLSLKWPVCILLECILFSEVSVILFTRVRGVPTGDLYRGGLPPGGSASGGGQTPPTGMLFCSVLKIKSRK